MQVLIAVDQLLNAALGGHADETLSARAHRMREKKHRYWGWTAGAIDRLFFWQTDAPPLPSPEPGLILLAGATWTA